MKLCDLYNLLSLPHDELWKREDISFSEYWEIEDNHVKAAVNNTLSDSSVFLQNIDKISEFIISINEVKFSEIECLARTFFKDDVVLEAASCLMPMLYLQSAAVALNEAMENAHMLLDQEEFHEQMVSSLVGYIHDQYTLNRFIQYETNRMIVMFMTNQN